MDQILAWHILEVPKSQLIKVSIFATANNGWEWQVKYESYVPSIEKIFNNHQPKDFSVLKFDQITKNYVASWWTYNLGRV